MKRKILVVDDSAVNRRILAKILQDEYAILEAEDGREALDIVRAECESLSAVLLDIMMPEMDGHQVLAQMRADAKLAPIPVIVTTGNTESGAEVKALSLGANDFIAKPYNPAIIKHRLWNTIHLRETAAFVNAVTRDRLTGLFNRETFFARASEMIAAHEPGYYIMACFDVDNFKVINDQYGSEKGDEVLRRLAEILRGGFEPANGICCRIMADNFGVLYPRAFSQTPEIKEIRRRAKRPDPTIQSITFSIGRYIVDDLSLSVSAMFDRATMAETSVKRRYDTHIALYDEAMREGILFEQRIVNEMNEALRGKQFEVWFQPQYNHSTGALIGAEALVRWRHPQRGLVPPNEFIPVFERNGFIYEMDKYVWEQVCSLLRGWLDAGRKPLPVSMNVSRYDLFRDDFFDTITALADRYDLPRALVRLEITESAFAKSTVHIIEIVQRLIDAGFTVEIDDFGSGYSSLNTLKDVPASILKLDMRFLEDNGNSRRGGNILESIVRMTKWLGMSVIAEGVETVEQADYLRSIGCSYVQGYLYARPMPVENYELLAARSDKEPEMFVLETVRTLDNNAFWDPRSMETLIFNSYVGGACIFEYRGNDMEILRVNDKYAQVLGGDRLPIEDALAIVWNEHMDEAGRAEAESAIRRAIETGEEVSCEATFSGLPGAHGRVCAHAAMRVIAFTEDRHLIYCTIEDVTAQREAERRIRASAEQLRFLNDVAHDLLGHADIDSGVESVLQKTLRYFGGSHAYIFEYNYAEDVCTYSYDACAPGVRSYKERYARFPLSTAWYWLETFSKTNFLYIDDPNALDATRAAEREVLRTLGVQSSLAVSLRVGDKVVGTMGVFDPVAHLSDYDNLAALGDYMAVILTRRDLDARIRSDNKTLMNMMNDTPGGFVRLKLWPDGRVKPDYINDGFCQLLHMSRETLERSLTEDICFAMHPDDVALVRRTFEEMRASGAAHSVKCRLRRADGGYAALLMSGRMVRNEKDEGYLNTYYTDISLESKLEEQRKELVENLPCGAGIYEFANGKLSILYLNKRYRELVNRKLERLEDAPVLEMIHPDDRARLIQELRYAITQNHISTCDIRLLYGASDYRPFRLVGNVVERAQGRVVIYVTYTPISKEELSFNEMLPVALAAMMSSSTDLSFVKDRNLRYICCSGAFARMVGLESETQITGLTDFDLFDEEMARNYTNDDRRLMASGESLVNYLEQIPSPDAIVRYSSTSKYLLHDAAGNVIGIYGTGRDVTEDREAYSRLKLLTDSIPGGLATYHCAPGRSRIVYYNDGFLDLLGTTADAYDQFSQIGPENRMFPEDVPGLRRQLDALLRENAAIDYTYRIHMPDGGFKWINLRGTPAERHQDAATVHAVLFDMTAQKIAEEASRESEQVFRAVVSHSSRMIFRYHIATHSARTESVGGNWTNVAPMLQNLPESVVESGIILPESVALFRDLFRAIEEGTPRGSTKIHARNAQGAARWIDVRYSLLYTRSQTPKLAVISFKDITEYHERELAYVRYRQTIEENMAADNGTLYMESDITTNVVERCGGPMLPEGMPEAGGGRGEIVNYIISKYIVEEERERCRKMFDREHMITQFSDGTYTLSEDWSVVFPSGKSGYIRSEVQMVQDPYSGHIKCYTLLRDVTDERLAAMDVRKRAQTDGMTGVYNKATTQAMVRQRLAQRDDAACALLIADLDNLKTINDNLGHPMGDRSLCMLADTLRTQFRRSDIVGRIGGDEFLVFLDGIGDQEKLRALMTDLVGKLSQIEIDGGGSLYASIGVATGSVGTDTFEELYARADKALYYAKRNGKRQYALYTPDM